MKRKYDSSRSSFAVPRQAIVSNSLHDHSILSQKSNEIHLGQKVSQESFASRETIAWGLTRGENYFETAYAQSYRDHPSSRTLQRVLAEPFLPPDSQLSGSLIPHETPKFTRTKKIHENRNSSNLENSFENESKSGRRQYPGIKYYDNHTRDTSLNNSQNYGNVSMTARSPSYDRQTPSKVLKTMHLHHSQVQESLCPESARESKSNEHLLLYTQIFNETRTAGSSDLRKRISPKKNGKKTYAEQYRGSPIKELMSQSFTDHTNQNQNRRETRSSSVLPSQSFQYKGSGNSSTQNRSRSTSPSNLNQEDAKLSQEQHISMVKINSHRREVSEWSKFSVEKLPRFGTEPDAEKRIVQSSQYKKEAQRTSRIPLTQRNVSNGRTRDGSQSARPVINEDKGSQKFNEKVNKNPTILSKKKILSNVSLPTGKIKQGSFSGVNKKYTA